MSHRLTPSGRTGLARAALAATASIVFATAAGPAVAAGDPAYLTELRAAARAGRLAEQRQWLALSHYAPDAIGGGVTSLIDNQGFFLAAGGKTDPAAELDATLAGFFADVPADGADNHPQCRRVSRYRWLKRQLTFDPARLPEIPCPAFEAWMTAINPGKVTLIFPAAYLDNPSTMFGHTLLRIDPPSQPTDARLTSYSVNFAADYGGEQGAAFAIKGLIGGYFGYFSVIPYYDKVTQYSDMENRDIWEYGLNLTPGEIEILLQNLWELDRQPVRYYFLSTNCSLVLLSLLNVARPDLQLVERFPIYAIPVDTIRAMIEPAGMLRDVVFRPSARTRVRDLQLQLPPADQRLAVELADGTLLPGDDGVSRRPEAVRARILELAQALLQYRLDRGEISRAEMAPRSIRLLQARAKLGRIAGGEAAAADNTSEAPERPDDSHRSVNLAAGAGALGSRAFLEFGGRPAYHGPLDPVAGFIPGSVIEILDVRLRYFWGRSVVPETLTLLSTESATPRDEIFRPWSWKIRLGAERFYQDADDQGDLVFDPSAGGGLTWLLADGLTATARLDAALFFGGDWPHDRVAGAGPAATVAWSPLPWWRLRLDGFWQAVIGSDETSARFRAAFGHGIRLTPDLSLQVSLGIRNDGDDTIPEVRSSLNLYY
jgi:hypothetical protein